jgi:flagellar hook-length control protein FliK
VAINSTPPPSSASALTQKAAAPGVASAKPPGYAQGTPPYPPQTLPGKAPVSPAPLPRPPVTAAAPATPGAPGAPGAATASGTAAGAAAKGPANAGDVLAPVQVTDDDDAPLLQGPPKAASGSGTSRARPRGPTPTPPGTATPTAPGAAPLAAGEAAPQARAPQANDEGPAAANADPDSAVADARPAPGTPPARAAAPQADAPAAPFSPQPLTAPIATATEATGTAITTVAAAVPPATSPRPAPAAAVIPASANDTGVTPRVASDDPGSDASVPGAEAAALLADPANVHDGTPAASAPAAAAMHTEVGANGWAEEVGSHVVWMVHQGVTDASLRLQPEHLGPLEVRISVHESDASVWFGASAPATRAALEQALPQLKEMFAAQGMTLSDAGVSRESSRETQYAPRAAASGGAADPETATPVSVAPRRGLIDTYA